MTVHGVCPECGTARPVSEFLADARERQALEAALRLDPRLADALLDYLSLFAPPGKKLQTRKLIRLLTELQEMVGAARVEVDRVTYAAPIDYWRMGMEEMAAKRGTLMLPISSHGYLRKVVFGIASKAAGTAQQKVEEQTRHRPRESSGGLVQVTEQKPRSGPPTGWKNKAFNKGGNDNDV